jgi:hypothetical protein
LRNSCRSRSLTRLNDWPKPSAGRRTLFEIAPSSSDAFAPWIGPVSSAPMRSLFGSARRAAKTSFSARATQRLWLMHARATASQCPGRTAPLDLWPCVSGCRRSHSLRSKKLRSGLTNSTTRRPRRYRPSSIRPGFARSVAIPALIGKNSAVYADIESGSSNNRDDYQSKQLTKHFTRRRDDVSVSCRTPVARRE